jgi:integrase
MPRPSRPKLGSHLEWHGQKIRVVIMVPPSLQKRVGSTKLREGLGTSDPKVAESIKWGVIQRLKDRIRGSEKGITPDPVIKQALQWREAISLAPGTGDPREVTPRDVLIEDVLPSIVANHGEDQANYMLAIAEGRRTPLSLFVDEMIKDRKYPPRTEAKFRRAIKTLTEWCEANEVAVAVESFDRRLTYRFLQEVFVEPGKNPETANDTLKWYGRFWRWMIEAGHLTEGTANPWDGRKMASDRLKRVAQGQAKRPFTDDEVFTLLRDITDQPIPDFSRIAALSGMRPAEIASLTVGNCANGEFNVTDGKTVNAIRRVPIHSALVEIVRQRTKGRPSDAPLFDDLPGEASDTRGPYAALSQTFTRRRRKLGIGETVENSKQDTVDFYSFRRWFMKKAAEQLSAGAKGFTAWTLAEVVGHSKESGELPLGLTMGRYPGPATEAAKRACIEAVTLPTKLSKPKELAPVTSETPSLVPG